MSIETTHAGHRVWYDEDDNLWRCHDFEIEAASLKALKTKMNAIDAEARRVDSVRAINLGHRGDEREPVIITMLVSDRVCWVTTIKSRRGRMSRAFTIKERSQVAYSQLVFETPETKAAMANYDVCRAAAEVAEKKAEKALADIPRITRAQLLELKVARAEEEA